MKKQLDAPEVASSRKIKFEESEKSEENEGSGESSSEEEESEIGHGLADVTFEDLQKARCDGTLAIHLKRDSNKSLKRANKNRPAETSSKKPVSKFREVVQAPKRVVRDPRFESLCGELDTERFKKKYNFIYEENLPSEKAELQKLLRTSNDPEAIEEMKSRISWIEKQLKSDSRKGREAQILAEHKKKEREAAKQGKKPYFLKKSEIRNRRLIEKFNTLKASGRIDKVIKQKRRQKTAKDRRFMPYKRSNDQQ